MGSYYDKLRALRDDYDHLYNNSYENYLWGKKQKDKYDNHSWDKKHDSSIVNVDVNCCDHKKDDKNTTKSAFRAVHSTPPSQIIPANTLVKVLYPNEQFDLASEYDPSASIFRPTHSGVYLIIASVQYVPNNSTVNYRVRVSIRVNGTVVAEDNDFFGPIPFDNDVSVSTIIQLQAGDIVDVTVISDQDGTIALFDGPGFAATHFEAVGFLSP